VESSDLAVWMRCSASKSSGNGANLHRFERFVAWNSRSKASPGGERLQGAIQVHFEIPPCAFVGKRVEIPGYAGGEEMTSRMTWINQGMAMF